MENKYFKFFIGFLVIIFLSFLFAFFILNAMMSELEMGNIFDFLKRAEAKIEEYKTGDFGHQIGEVVEDPVYGGTVAKVDPADLDGQGHADAWRDLNMGDHHVIDGVLRCQQGRYRDILFLGYQQAGTTGAVRGRTTCRRLCHQGSG